MSIVIEPSPDRQTPATDQLFAVRVAKYTTNPDDKLFGVSAASTTSAAAKYYVGPNSVVVGSRSLANYTATGTKRRAVGSPVHDVIGSKPDKLGANDESAYFIASFTKLFSNFRVYGVAPDGVPMANAEGVDDNHDSLGRFSVIHHGVATINCPYDLGNAESTAAYGFKDKKIGDVVLVDPFSGHQPYTLSSDPAGVVPFPVTFLSREVYHRLFSAGITLPQNGGRSTGYRPFNLSTTVVDAHLRKGIGADLTTLRELVNCCMVGFLLETGGNRRNEIRVQLRLDASSYAHQARSTAALQTLVTQTGIQPGGTETVDTSSFGLVPKIDTVAFTAAGPFTNAISAGMGDSLPEDCYAGSGPGSVLGMSAAVVANVTGVPVGPVGPGTDPVLVAECFANAPPAALGIGPDLKPVPGSIAAQLMGHPTSAPATSGQVSAITGAIGEIGAGNVMTGEHDVEIGGVVAAAKDLPPEVVAMNHLAGGTGSVAHPAMVRGLYPDGVTLCPLQTAGINGPNREAIQAQIAAAVDGVRRMGGPCVHTFGSAGEMAGALENMIRGGL